VTESQIRSDRRDFFSLVKIAQCDKQSRNSVSHSFMKSIDDILNIMLIPIIFMANDIHFGY
jgi:hypothetical protein